MTTRRTKEAPSSSLPPPPSYELPRSTGFGYILLIAVLALILSVAAVVYSGKDGPAGPQGPAGVVGAAGPAGSQGSDGPQGLVGPQGPQGEKGDKGDTGAVGAAGVAGVCPNCGTSVTPQPTVVSGAPNTGSLYLLNTFVTRGTTGTLYGVGLTFSPTAEVWLFDAAGTWYPLGPVSFAPYNRFVLAFTVPTAAAPGLAELALRKSGFGDTQLTHPVWIQ